MNRNNIYLTIILAITVLLYVSVFAAVCQADVYVLKDKNTNECVLISDNDNIVNNSADNEVVVLPHTVEFYNLTEDYSLYLLKNKKFSLNTDKVTEKENKKEADKQKKIKDDGLAETAKIKLIGLGFTEDEADYLTR